MEIILTVIGVLIFFGGSYFLGDLLEGDEYDASYDKVMNSLLGMLVMVVIFLIVIVVSVCVHEGIVLLIN